MCRGWNPQLSAARGTLSLTLQSEPGGCCEGRDTAPPAGSQPAQIEREWDYLSHRRGRIGLIPSLLLSLRWAEVRFVLQETGKFLLAGETGLDLLVSSLGGKNDGDMTV